MKDRVLEQQRSGRIMGRYAPDPEQQPDQQVAWETLAGIDVVPRRSPWKTPGADSEDILAEVSDRKVTINMSNAPSFAIASASTGGGTRRTVKVITRVYISGNNLMAEYQTLSLNATLTASGNEVIAEGASCTGT
jgi:hypothetical protein